MLSYTFLSFFFGSGVSDCRQPAWIHPHHARGSVACRFLNHHLPFKIIHFRKIKSSTVAPNTKTCCMNSFENDATHVIKNLEFLPAFKEYRNCFSKIKFIFAMLNLTLCYIYHIYVINMSSLYCSYYPLIECWGLLRNVGFMLILIYYT